MFNRSKLSDGSELLAHTDTGVLVLAKIVLGETVWQVDMPVDQAVELRNFLSSQWGGELDKESSPVDLMD